MKELLGNILPYLGIEPEYSEKELKLDEVKEIEIGNYVEKEIGEAKKELNQIDLQWEIKGGGKQVKNQFPIPGEKVNKGSSVILYTE